MIYKLSYLNSNLALTLGYLNPALNNLALALTSSGREGWEKLKHRMACKQQAIAKHFAKNCKQATAYTSHEVPPLKVLGHP